MPKISVVQIAKDHCYECGEKVKIDQSDWIEVTETEMQAAGWWCDQQNKKAYSDNYVLVRQASSVLENVKDWVIQAEKEKQEYLEKKAQQEVAMLARKAAKQKISEKKERLLLEELQKKYGTSSS